MIPESVTKEAIGVLIDLAERGEINPWDVDVIDVVDRFLAHLVDKDRRGLYDSGQALLYASMLILLKAQTLSQVNQVVTEENDNEPIVEMEDGTKLPIDLEKHIRRRSSAPPPPSRKITLQELITQLELLSAEMNKEPRKRTKSYTKKINTNAELKAISQLAHKENLTEIATALEEYLTVNHGVISVSELGEIFNDKVGVFWGLLLLSAQSKVSLHQEDFYGNILVESLIPDRLQA